MAASKNIVLVAALARNHVIGKNGTMPWHLPADLQHFKKVTQGHPIVMGRRTFESIGRALPGRQNIVISRSLPQAPAGCVLARALDDAVQLAEGTQVMVIGGGTVYREAMPSADRLELTLIDAAPDGDTTFPDFGSDWRLERMHVRLQDARNAFRLVFCSLVRGV